MSQSLRQRCECSIFVGNLKFASLRLKIYMCQSSLEATISPGYLRLKMILMIVLFSNARLGSSLICMDLICPGYIGLKIIQAIFFVTSARLCDSCLGENFIPTCHVLLTFSYLRNSVICFDHISLDYIGLKIILTLFLVTFLIYVFPFYACTKYRPATWV